MLLVIDISNTSTILGIFEDTTLISNWKLSTNPSRSSDEIGVLLTSVFDYSNMQNIKIENVIISSVVPDVMYSFINAIKKYFNCTPMIVGSGTKTGIKLTIDNPKEMGSNRIVNLVAALEITHSTSIVIDYNTATTYDVIDEKGNFLTGLTCPGIETCANALYQKAANLPKFEIKMPSSLTTKNTLDSMQAGLVLGQIGQTKYIISKIKEELNLHDAKIIATGGLARVIENNENIFDVYDPVLSLKGLLYIYYKNTKKQIPTSIKNNVSIINSNNDFTIDNYQITKAVTN